MCFRNTISLALLFGMIFTTLTVIVTADEDDTVNHRDQHPALNWYPNYQPSQYTSYPIFQASGIQSRQSNSGLGVNEYQGYSNDRNMQPRDAFQELMSKNLKEVYDDMRADSTEEVTTTPAPVNWNRVRQGVNRMSQFYGMARTGVAIGRVVGRILWHSTSPGVPSG